MFNRKWIVSGDSAIYHYLYFDPDSDELTSLSVYEFEGRPWQLSERTFAARVTFSDVWEGQDVWVRKFSSLDGPSLPYDAATTRKLMDLEPPEYFKTERPDAELMNFRELEAYIEDLRASGFDVVSLLVALHRKISFPFRDAHPHVDRHSVRCDNRSQRGVIRRGCGYLAGVRLLGGNERVWGYRKFRTVGSDHGGLGS